MRMNGLRALLLSVMLVPLAALAQSEVSVSRLYLVNPDQADISNTIDALEAAIKTRDYRPTKQIGLMPSELPDKPGEPESRPINIGPVSINMLSCGNAAYAQFGTSSGTSNGALGDTSDRTFGCLFLSKRGLRMAIVLEQKSSTSTGLMGSLLGGIKSTVRGSDKDYAQKAFDNMLKAVREKIPGVLVELQEFPGEVTRPDEGRIKELAMSSPGAKAVVPVAQVQNISQPSQTVDQNQIEGKLRELKRLYESGLIDKEVYLDRQKAILSTP